MADKDKHGHRAGSRKARVHEVFDRDGAEEAIKFGEELGLATPTVRQWVKAWGGTVPKVRADTFKPKQPKQTKQENSSKPDREDFKIIFNEQQRVRFKDDDYPDDPEWKGRILKYGPEQCEIKWDNGNVNVVPTHWLEPETGE